VPDIPVPEGWVRPVLTGHLAGGVPRDLVLWPDPRLRARCEPSGYLKGPELRSLVADMLATMYAAGGRGLAAPQIGVMRRIFVMDAGWKEGRPEPLVTLDPEVVARSAEMSTATEQCLSIPGRPVDVLRPSAITLAWYDLDGRHYRGAFTGAAARIAQHEADHLDGRLIVEG
jgi:peptide deformylase